MNQIDPATPRTGHNHVFLGTGHEKNERKTWRVIALCSIMMLVEIIGGSLFGSLALVADGLHMSTHAGAMLIAALAYTYARRHANDERFVFDGDRGEIVTLSWWTSLDAIRAFAGDPVDQARYYPADAEYLLTRPATVLHYESSELYSSATAEGSAQVP